MASAEEVNLEERWQSSLQHSRRPRQRAETKIDTISEPSILCQQTLLPFSLSSQKILYIMFIFMIVLCLGHSSFLPIVLAAPEDDSVSSWYVRVTIPSLGTLQGIRRLGVDFFGGIPYAAPPVGNLRWAAPEEPPSWRPHILDATHFGPDCSQVVDPSLNPLADSTQMSEDCLYLNIYTPAGAASYKTKLPVMVWFHGGAFQQGSAKRPEYDGRRLAQDENVVVVTANYRLGSLGFLVSSELGLYGNYGLMDQRAVLYFVQQNIERFGGDANSITLFGESAGAVMIGLHLLMENNGLFHRAILQSNPMGYQFRSVVVADFLGDALRRAVDCRDLACLQSEPVEEILRAQSSLMGIPRSVGDFFAWGPTLTHHRQLSWNAAGASGSTMTGGGGGGPLEERSLFSVETYAKHRESTKFAVNVSQPLLNLNLVPDHIPIIIGTNRHEGEMFVHGAFPLTMSKAVYWMFVGALFKDSASRVLKHYRIYVEQLEQKAQQIAERQLLEEEHRQYYLEHQEELEEDYAWMLAQNKKLEENRGDYSQVVSPEVVEQLVQTFNSGGGEGGKNLTWWRQATEAVRNIVPTTGNSSSKQAKLGEGTANTSWWKRGVQRLSEKPSPEVLEMRRLAREARIKERARQRALKEAAKVVIDYRPVMSRIINDYLFRCPSWHYAHLLSRNRVQKQKNNNVYVYRFSQPTHVPGYKECWGKSCHTAELPYVFRAMDVIRSNYSTLSKFAQMEAPVAPDYPYTDMMKAYQEIVQRIESRQNSQNGTDERPSIPYDLSVKPVYDPGELPPSNHTMSFQRILKHFFNDYFHSDADDETSADMAQRWVAFARTGDPNYDDAQVQWVPWRYIPSQDRDLEDFDRTNVDSDPLDGFVMEEEFWKRNDDGTSEWDEDRFGQVLRERALQALTMEVVEEDELRTELRFSNSAKPDPDNPFFSLKFLSYLGTSATSKSEDDGSSSAARRQAQRAAQEMGVLGTGLRGEERSGGIFPSQQSSFSDDFFPQLLELMWPPEGRLVERDCTCDFWDRIRYRY